MMFTRHVKLKTLRAAGDVLKPKKFSAGHSYKNTQLVFVSEAFLVKFLCEILKSNQI